MAGWLLGVITAAAGRLDPDGGDLDVTGGWGHTGKGGAVMPGQGKAVERPYDAEERAAIEQGGKVLGLALEGVMALLGETTVDVYLNERAYWKNIPARVWEYRLGGYEVIRKWLSYRENRRREDQSALLGRSLTSEEARYVTNMAQRIASILLLGPALDANYESVKRACYGWSEKLT